jgi:hypothetical protein
MFFTLFLKNTDRNLIEPARRDIDIPAFVDQSGFIAISRYLKTKAVVKIEFCY